MLTDSGRLTALATLLTQCPLRSCEAWLGTWSLGLAPVREAMVNNMSEIAIGYKHSPLNGHAVRRVKGPSSGGRVVPLARQAPFGSGDMPRFALLAGSNDAVKSLVREFDDLVDPAIRPPLNDGAMWLVRPVGYVGCSGTCRRHGNDRRLFAGGRSVSRSCFLPSAFAEALDFDPQSFGRRYFLRSDRLSTRLPVCACRARRR